MCSGSLSKRTASFTKIREIIKFFKLKKHINKKMVKFKQRVKEWKAEIIEHKNKIILALFFIILASFIYFLAGSYTTTDAKVSEVSDLILDHIPAINNIILIFLYVWVFALLTTFLYLYPLIFNPKKIHYFLGLIGLWIFIRSIFIILTHLKTPADAIILDLPWLIRSFYFQNDLFFSGHTGLPFLGYLIFRKENKSLSYLFLAASIIMGITVLLLHQHYSIDVLAAFFITYGIYKIGDRIFNGK